ncbi:MULTISPECIES: nicotinate-nucleotide--dimethylbenzimidazole phosphoribosyltransferase [Paenibacillus]|uniref:nicotinate-nucleotide--dimethylbenzimidazole phosphoribosyltransferase n=1 Tax=Paenibacillus TaxID=44249 RepID=UPI00096CE56B|nr:nicotinate-nucleotide--dimethylbenzimidazole phosphoribosyltransferase [Paenibacillus peoriae]OMF75553.1 nicotinate-nucleotide--dimethylbenzimidazole phosphoribosyltransferase [Paenibacillus peoriae]OMF82690.1 nicotinate-nucleotide--dimethylbenzimidazole phosphoribosyltransferase [Paenibacillus peoriae]
MNNKLRQLIDSIAQPDGVAASAASAHLDQLTKPPGSLGKLESVAIQLAGITGVDKPEFDRKTVMVMAADHGVCEEGVSAFPAEVTQQMLYNMLSGGAAINVLARHAGADVKVVDVGVNADVAHANLVDRKVRMGTSNIAKGPAMLRTEAEQAVLAGAEAVAEAVKGGTRLFVTGELGIGNTTASAAVVCALTGLEPEVIVGRGTGVDMAGLTRKISVVCRALDVNQPDANDAFDVLTKVGGLEIAALAGVILGAAAHRCPVVLDGFISGAAALAARALAPASAAYMLASHASDERGHAAVLRQLKLEPMLHLDMRLGEGTGGALSLHLIDAACRIMREMATFADAGVSDGQGAAQR